MAEQPPFESFSSIPRLAREMTVTEKIDGTNSLVCVADDLSQVWAGSRSRWITPDDDNFGFARWVAEHAEELKALGPGKHYGEWWGAGVQRRYGLKEKRFSLFNVSLWGPGGKHEAVKPACCGVVPVLYRGPFNVGHALEEAEKLRVTGSVAAPGFMKPEGIVVFHEAAKVLFKYTLDGDAHKTLAK